MELVIFNLNRFYYTNEPIATKMRKKAKGFAGTEKMHAYLLTGTEYR